MTSGNLIHPTAIVHPGAQLGEGTRVGPYSIIDEHVVTGRNCEIQEHVVVRGRVRLGDEVRIFPGAVIGAEPQHLRYKGEPTSVEIGNQVTLREAVTVHRGTEFGAKATRIGDRAYIMAYTHVAHDCLIGNSVILANCVQLAGHVEVGDFVTIGGLSAVAQFCRIGRYCYVGGGSIMRKDVPPFLLGKGTDFEVQGINSVGLTRNGFSETTVRRLKSLYRIFFIQKLTVAQAIEKIITELGESDEVRFFIQFIQTSQAGFVR